jgi:protein required for attachment to host cells
MEKNQIPHHALILVCDGRKALFMRNEGDEKFPALKVARVLAGAPNPPTHLQGTDKPGRVLDRASGRYSNVQQLDWHTLAEADFAHEIAAALEVRLEAHDFDKLIIVAPPRTLAELRASLSEKVQKTVIAEHHKDLTKHPVHEIERLLSGH